MVYTKTLVSVLKMVWKYNSNIKRKIPIIFDDIIADTKKTKNSLKIAKDPFEAEFQLLINKWESVDWKHSHNPKPFIGYLNDIDDICENIGKYNSNKKLKILITFDDMITDMVSKKILNPIVTELFIKERKLKISFVFITQSYFAVPKNIRLNCVHYFIMKIPNMRELQQIAVNHWSDIDFKDCMNP